MSGLGLGQTGSRSSADAHYALSNDKLPGGLSFPFRHKNPTHSETKSKKNTNKRDPDRNEIHRTKKRTDERNEAMAMITTPQRPDQNPTRSMDTVMTPTGMPPMVDGDGFEPDPFFEEVEARFDTGRLPYYSESASPQRGRPSAFGHGRSGQPPTSKPSRSVQTKRTVPNPFFDKLEARTSNWSEAASPWRGTPSSLGRVRPLRSTPTVPSGENTASATGIATAIAKRLKRAASASIEEIQRDKKRRNQYRIGEAESFVSTLRDHHHRARISGAKTSEVSPLVELAALSAAKTTKRQGFSSPDQAGVGRSPPKRIRAWLSGSRRQPKTRWVPNKTVRSLEENPQSQRFVDSSTETSCKRRMTHRSSQHDQRRVPFGLGGESSPGASPKRRLPQLVPHTKRHR